MKPLASLNKKFGCIVSDPPWPESGGGKIKRGADRHYPLMTVAEIAALPVAGIALPDAHLYMWITNNYLARGAHVQVAQAWGFKPVTVLTWLKRGRIGLGQYFRGITEHCVFCVRGAPPYRTFQSSGGVIKRAQGVTAFDLPLDGLDVSHIEIDGVRVPLDEGAWWEEPRPGAHSKKPNKIHEWAELVSPGPRLEMFARRPYPGWESWGNEAPQEEDPFAIDEVDPLS